MVVEARRASAVFYRGLWVLMAAAHAPAFAKVWGSFFASGFEAAKLGGCIALTLAMLFFALKFHGVAFLGLRTTRRSFVAMCLIIAVIHIDVVRPQTQGDTLPRYATLVVATVLVGGLARVHRTIAAVLRRAGAPLPYRSSTSRSPETVWLDTFRPHCWVLASRLFLLRAPPR